MRLPLGTLLALLAGPALAAVTFEEEAPAPRPAAPAARPAPTPRAAPAPRPRPPREERAPRDEATPVSTQPAEPASRGLVMDSRARCGIWAPDLQPGEALEWSGPCSNGVANGTGELLRRNGDAVVSLTQGRFAGGKLEGPANISLANGAHLEAEFAGGIARTGTIRFGDASTYQGEIRGNLPNGRGSRSWPRGPEYDGQWVNGVRTGEGRQQDGYGVYSGEWRNDRRNGRGVQIYQSGDRYDGMWRDDQRNGQGVMTWSGGVYEGEWRNDRRNGQGTEAYRNGARFSGQFVDDLPSGPGVLVAGDGTRFEGRMTGGCLATERGIFRILPGPGNC
ncbi:hypothetical protein JMJ55_00010 [Belnapia sp. T6]|uniref:MORN repeat-containing protein n=1 Tax=Belnapia mucosa TaxID=2804532 RepID=A0ABS1V073_9PROT|nr:hypothetical protein [Belnapia mucosa]MBL6453683.1 hypothetical protein [Belnapia mucosa]